MKEEAVAAKRYARMQSDLIAVSHDCARGHWVHPMVQHVHCKAPITPFPPRCHAMSSVSEMSRLRDSFALGGVE